MSRAIRVEIRMALLEVHILFPDGGSRKFFYVQKSEIGNNDYIIVVIQFHERTFFWSFDGINEINSMRGIDLCIYSVHHPTRQKARSI